MVRVDSVGANFLDCLPATYRRHGDLGLEIGAEGERLLIGEILRFRDGIPSQTVNGGPCPEKPDHLTPCPNGSFPVERDHFAIVNNKSTGI